MHLLGLRFLLGACRECILTIDKLMARGKIMVNGCYLYKKVAESCNHILLWYPMAYEL